MITKALRGFLFEETEEKTGVSTPVPSTTTPAKIGAMVGTPAPPSGEADPSILTPLRQAVFYDSPYLMLTRSVESLKAVIPDEIMRLKSAFVAASATSGLDIARLQGAVSGHVTALEKEKSKFERTLKEQTDFIAAKNTEIDNLEKEITRFEERRNLLKNEVSSEQDKIDSVRGRFNAACRVIEQELQIAKDNISRHLGS